MDRFFNISKLNAVLLVFVAVLLLSFHFFFIYFINSTYITAFVGEKLVSLVYAGGAILNISLFLLAPKILRKTGIVKMTLMLTAGEVLSLLVLAFPIHPSMAIMAFLLHMAVSSILLYCMDMLLECYAKTEQAGSLRGMFLTMWNLPPVITPFMAGIILGTDMPRLGMLGTSTIDALYNAGFWKIYLIAALFLVPFVVIIKSNFKQLKEPEYPRMYLKETLYSFYKNQNLFDVFADRLLLNLFFAWNVVYIPIYLYEYIGFSWEKIGVILSIISLPYVLFQRFVGKIEDKKRQEKSLLIAGFLLMAVTTIMLPFLTVSSMSAWLILLFVAHTGAAIVEVSSESYFFRHVSPTNSGFISLFRLTRTMPYIIMPPVIAVCLYFLPFNYMFIIFGLSMLLGVRYAFMIKDRHLSSDTIERIVNQS